MPRPQLKVRSSSGTPRGTGLPRLGLIPTLSDQLPVRVLVCSLHMNRCEPNC